MIVANQDDIFEWYSEFCAFLGREPHPGQFTELKGLFEDGKLIEVWIAVHGGNTITWRFGHVDKLMENLYRTFGEDCVPYLTIRKETPLHGGGEAYGEEHLERSKMLVRVFCGLMLREIEMYRIGVFHPE